ncbi:MAG: hypothetical protein QM774_02595 [Gordonia sp. (in: high G+C Gram-positive bacteria)]|uniref:hypothetical protein n=1 Tax=Gordonia sp. (in: high G+C Gram-positive bacteria) TaxID=84139 RepID=UPI0039E53203
MKRHTTLAAVGAVAAATAVTASMLAAPNASAGPITQIPAVGFQVSGLVIPGAAVVNVFATPLGKGKTRFSAPLDPGTCASSAGGALVHIDYVNTGSGRRGGVTVNPCPNIRVGSATATATTGAGQVVTTSFIQGSGYKPNAGQPSLPGVGTFTAR